MTLTMGNETAWSQPTFARLFAASPKKAFEYRFQVLGTPIPEEYLDVKEETKVEVVEETENTELSRDKLKELVKNAGVEFPSNIKTDKLKELALENNLI